VHHLVTTTSPPHGLAARAALAEEAVAFHRALPAYAVTPLHRLDALASEAGIGSLLLKDEAHRFGLGAFKGLGASFAMARWLARAPGAGPVTFATATDGNHGRAVAWSARQLGHRAVILIPAHAAVARIEAIRAEGAEVRLVPEGYDAAVRMVHALAEEHGWVVIQDTASPGYEEVPEWIAAGYWTHARELEPWPHAADGPDVDVVLLHAGVGTWAAAMTAYYWSRYGARRPRLAVVEPVRAPCCLEAARRGGPVEVPTAPHTIMAGLDCGLASSAAMRVLSTGVDAFFAIEDDWAREAMRRLANPPAGAPRVVAGESGAASVGALLALQGEPALAPVRAHLGLGPDSRVLVWSTEGATDPAHWAAVVGHAVPKVPSP
jgi:diaminopropionate ammonia-lyase